MIATIAALLAEGRNFVVHCHHGQSRTGLALRAWLIRANDWDEPTSTEHLAELWPSLSLHNSTFTEFLPTWDTTPTVPHLGEICDECGGEVIPIESGW